MLPACLCSSSFSLPRAGAGVQGALSPSSSSDPGLVPEGCEKWLRGVLSQFRVSVNRQVDKLAALDNGSVKCLKHAADTIREAQQQQAAARAQLQLLPAARQRTQQQHEAAALYSTQLQQAEKRERIAYSCAAGVSRRAPEYKSLQADVAVVALSRMLHDVLEPRLLPAAVRGDEQQQQVLVAAAQGMAAVMVMSGMEQAQHFLEVEYSRAMDAAFAGFLNS